MKILFSAAHFGYFRNFELAITVLAERGHRVHLAADEPESIGGLALVERLAARYPGVTFGFGPSLDDAPWFRLARKLRAASDYVRFHEEEFTSFRKTRLTLRERIPHAVLHVMDGRLGRSQPARRALAVALRAAEAAMPISDVSRAFVEEHDPDVVLVASVTAWRRRTHGGPCRAEQCQSGLPLPGLGPAPSGGLTTNSRRTGSRGSTIPTSRQSAQTSRSIPLTCSPRSPSGASSPGSHVWDTSDDGPRGAPPRHRGTGCSGT